MVELRLDLQHLLLDVLLDPARPALLVALLVAPRCQAVLQTLVVRLELPVLVTELLDEGVGPGLLGLVALDLRPLPLHVLLQHEGVNLPLSADDLADLVLYAFITSTFLLVMLLRGEKVAYLTVILVTRRCRGVEDVRVRS